MALKKRHELFPIPNILIDEERGENTQSMKQKVLIDLTKILAVQYF